MSIAKSKMVECEICGLHFHARGLHPHMRQKHGIIVKIVTKVTSLDNVPDLKPNIGEKGSDLKQVPEVDFYSTTNKKEVRPYKPTSDDFIWYYKKHPEEAKKEWEHFKAAAERTNDLVWLVSDVRHKILQRMFEPSENNP